MIKREPNNRPLDGLRPVKILPQVNRYAEGSALIHAGNTQVLCTVSLEPSVPKWLEGKGKGWVTAEYSMLPRSTHTRCKRDREKVSGRTQEIQRLIGRALRSIVDMKALGENSLIVDCDVLQADGGTRTASITGGCVALVIALESLKEKGLIANRPWSDLVCAVSIGLKGSQILTDLDYDEDSSCDVDMNFVVKGNAQFVEVQGTAERNSFSKQEMDRMTEAALSATLQLQNIQNEVIKEYTSKNK